MSEKLHEQNKLMLEIERKLDFTIMFALFFPTLLYPLSKLTDPSESKASEVIISWVSFLPFYILNFLLFFNFKKNATKTWKKLTYYILNFNIVIFAVLMILISIYKNGPIFGFSAAFFKIAVFMAFTLPISLFCILFINLVIYYFKKI